MTIDAAVGRRERKKQATRESLIEAAFAIFVDKGFDATTVEEIADAVDVSSRTFFRYFASKEDVVLTFQEEQQAMFIARFEARPPAEPVLTALKHAAIEVAHACETGVSGFDPARFVALKTIMETSSSVLASSLQHQQQKQQVVAEAIAARMGVDPADDLRPHVVAAIANCGMRTAADCWEQGGSGPFGSLSDVIRQAFTLLEESINYPSAAAAAASRDSR
ncbi:MAG: TetR family transcriptional regulator [Streptosporangiaceae bacterium]